MRSADLLIDGFDRVRDEVNAVLDGLHADEVAFRIDEESNSIGWLLWHLTRVQDDHVGAAAQREQVWLAHGFEPRFNLPFEPSATGYAQSPDEAGHVQVTAGLLAEYHQSVHAATVEYIDTLSDQDLDRVVDTHWNPPVVLGVRLISVLADSLQHVGQAAMVRGVARRRPLPAGLRP